MSATAAIAVAGPRRSIEASRPPTTMLPSSAQKTKNFVLSQIHGCRTMRFGTANHSHIGENHVGNDVGNARRATCAAIMSGASKDAFQTQNHTKSGMKNRTPWCTQSVNDSQPGSRQ